ncbi:LysR substrate-binding domain-containing protein [Rhizobium sp. YJ-22]|uniref:LysR substrate-binding domain-containing protein n=1 Tax=Rhizobium sp. YJ-22 TaxID=3037556 RepID=UPI00241288E8|nr:LysR substrate-binding domain-containing protein [Rhizobium sp. YJ-22]MDG3574944.1 LysR substrate-binding domain-containing protein [Rhizobium sp. YJ-22]
MKRGRLPLTALRSFEAAGRLESITLAAEELFVSQAAVSRQIRGLEDQLGKALFERHHRAIKLTPAGRDLLDVLVACFDRMEGAVQAAALTPMTRALVRISVEPSFAAGRLLPALPQFNAQHPDIDVQVDSDPRLVSFRVNGPVLAVRYAPAARNWPKTQARLLYECEMAVVAAPSLLAEQGMPREPAELLDLPLVHEENRDLWKRWLAAAGLPDTGSERGPIFDDAALVLQSALRGQGVAIVDLTMAREDLLTGRIVRLFEPVLVHGAYFLVARDFQRLAPAARQLADWLSTAFAASP